jgi:hypothetical protein
VDGTNLWEKSLKISALVGDIELLSFEQFDLPQGHVGRSKHLRNCTAGTADSDRTVWRIVQHIAVVNVSHCFHALNGACMLSQDGFTGCI